MQIAKLLKVRSSLMFALLLFAAATPACAQEKPKRMIPGASVKELVPETPNETENGISQIIYGQLFKPGTTEYTHVGAKALKDAPPLPTGYVLFKDLVYRIKTEAITSGSQITVFSLPSADNETDFGNLGILHFEDDEMSPAGSSWAEVTIFPGGWDEHFNSVSKTQYDVQQRDFKSRRIAAISHHFGLFAVALFQETQPRRTGPFTQTEVKATSSPGQVSEDHEVTHTIIVKNKGPNSVAEVDVKEEVDTYLQYISATSTQGTCKESTQSNGRVLCYLGSLPAGASASIKVVSRVRHNMILTKDANEVVNFLEVVFKENPTDFVEADNQVMMQFNTTILKKQ